MDCTIETFMYLKKNILDRTIETFMYLKKNQTPNNFPTISSPTVFKKKGRISYFWPRKGQPANPDWHCRHILIQSSKTEQRLASS